MNLNLARFDAVIWFQKCFIAFIPEKIWTNPFNFMSRYWKLLQCVGDPMVELMVSDCTSSHVKVVQDFKHKIALVNFWQSATSEVIASCQSYGVLVAVTVVDFVGLWKRLSIVDIGEVENFNWIFVETVLEKVWDAKKMNLVFTTYFFRAFWRSCWVGIFLQWCIIALSCSDS